MGLSGCWYTGAGRDVRRDWDLGADIGRGGNNGGRGKCSLPESTDGRVTSPSAREGRRRAKDVRRALGAGVTAGDAKSEAGAGGDAERLEVGEMVQPSPGSGRNE